MHAKVVCDVIIPQNLHDRSTVTALLAEAFQDDPVMSFIFPDDDDRRKRLPRLFAILYDGDGAHGARFATSGFEAASLWRAPGMGRLSLFEKLQYGLPWIRATGVSLSRALAVSAASDAAHPSKPHWYLHIVGCRQASRKQGFATATLKSGLAKADQDGFPTYLETATEQNIGFYQHLGFKVTGEWRVPKGPQHWSLLREQSSR
jgi:GNAT superfamily N-acetyltransferase